LIQGGDVYFPPEILDVWQWTDEDDPARLAAIQIKSVFYQKQNGLRMTNVAAYSMS
jgi:hypothetical protein